MSYNQCWHHRPRAVVVAWIFFLALFFHLAVINNDPPPRLQDPSPMAMGMYHSLDPDVIRKETKNYGSSVVVHLNTTWNSALATSRRAEYSRRRDRVKKICGTTKTFQRSLDSVHRTILWDQQDHLMWCPVLKAASTTWMKNFGQLAKSRKIAVGGKKMRAKSHQIYRKPDYAELMLKTALKFMIARHPFSRLLSAYRDKMLAEKSPEGHFAILQKEIVKQYQKPYIKEARRRKRRVPLTKAMIEASIKKKKKKAKEDMPHCEDLTPDESVDDANVTVYLSTSIRNGSTLYHPTFTQFLMRVRDDMKQMWSTGGSCLINKHWLPYWVSCSPCQVDYDVLAKVETIDLDNEYIIQESKLQGKFINMRTHAAISDGFKSSSEAIKYYFSQVPVGLLGEILELYKPDFQLFEYDPEPYLKLARSDSSSSLQGQR